MKTSKLFLCVLLSVTTLSEITWGGSYEYTITDLGTLGGALSVANAINNNGQVAGRSSYDSSGYNHAFLWQSGSGIEALGGLGKGNDMTRGINDSRQVVGRSWTGSNYDAVLWDPSTGFHDLGSWDNAGLSAIGEGINNSGQIVGSATDSSGHSHVFVHTGDGSLSPSTDDRGTLGGAHGFGRAINSSGQIVGWSNPSGSPYYHAFLHMGNGPLSPSDDLGTLGGTTSAAYGINGNGQVVGNSTFDSSGYTHAFLWQSGTGMQDLGTLGGTTSAAYGINSSGLVVGDAFTAGGADHAFVRDPNGAMRDLNGLIDPSSGWTLQVANGINNSGQIVGSGLIGGNTHAFLVTPNTMSAGGGTGTTGGIQATFSDMVSPGVVTSTYLTPADSVELQQEIGAAAASQMHFIVPNGQIQLWNVGFNGVASGPTQVVFHYDPTLIGETPESELAIYHFENGGWELLTGVVDINAHTIAVTTDGFSPFALGEVPEPSAFSLLTIGAMCLLGRIWRRTRGAIGVLGVLSYVSVVRSSTTAALRLRACVLILLCLAATQVHAQGLRTLASFNQYRTGGGLFASLTLSGNTLYGTAAYGGPNGAGTVFSLSVDGGDPMVLTSFYPYTIGGASPYAGLTLSSDGTTLYGTTQQGGAKGAGVVFSVPVSGGVPSVLGSFNGSSNGLDPGGLTLVGDTLYGVAGGGGNVLPNYPYGAGVVFSVPVSGGDPAVLAAFDGSNGATPNCELTLIGDTLYGTTAYGGPNGCGTVFSVPVSGGVPTVLASFSASSTGYYASGSLTLSGDTLYGTTAFGGAYGYGTVFSVPVSGGIPTVLASLSDGSSFAGVTLVGNVLYGTTSAGGPYRDGTIFSIPLSGGIPTVLASFNWYDGQNPDGGLVLSGNTLYGTTAAGGDYNNGTVFALTLPEPSTWTLLSIGVVGVSLVAGWRRDRRHRFSILTQ